jgi:hypothetical protein
LGGSQTLVDTPLEIALLSYSAGVVDVRPAKAVEMLPASNPRLADLKLGAATYMEMQMARFSGKDPAPYAAALKFITDRGKVSEADIKRFMAQGIAAEVDAQFNRVVFAIRDTAVNKTYNAVLARNAQNQYVLSYERPSVENDDKELTAPILQTLLDAMRRNTADFSQTSIDQVRAQAALIPAVSQAGKTGTAEPRALLTYGLTAFYTANTDAEKANALKIIEGIYVTRLYPMEYKGPQEREKAIAAEDAIYAVLRTFSPELLGRVSSEINALLAALQSNRPELENIVNQAEKSLTESAGGRRERRGD